MPELTPVYPVPIESIEIERGATAQELALWQKLLKEFSNSSNALDSAGLLLENIYITFSFANRNDVILVSPDPDIEQRYYQLRQDFEKLKSAIRGVEDHRYGIMVKNGDLDILQPPDTQMSGLIIPVIIGGIIVGTAIAAAIYQTKQSLEIAMEYRRIIARTDKTLCSDKNSELCKKWEKEKQDTGYTKNQTLAESLSSSVSKVTSGLGIGLLIAIPAIAILLAKR